MSIRPIDLARHLGISTTTLRGYEERGLVPRVPRSPAGYRYYDDQHVAYFLCIRALLPAFDLTFITAVLGKVQAAHIDDALWIANKAQTDLWHERQSYLKTVDVLLHQSGPPESSSMMSIGEISSETGIPVTTIRYWEKAGLLTPERNRNNGYRIYTGAHIRQLLTLNAIKLSVRTHRLKHFFQTMQETYQAFDFSNHKEIKAFLEKVRQQLDIMNRLQIRSISALDKLCQQVESGQFEPFGTNHSTRECKHLNIVRNEEADNSWEERMYGMQSGRLTKSRRRR
ncbi:MerR family transcriptional regulator [Paenibacillus daejeonensis]|uniref:MerR family transcriptional regulator n=1 Tax=Paenibacillus daejeonensis TaxID=135193 RepID=UPI000379DF61|nr:MerR family transcriptional regulator [Paenibacillus daejeonensis]